MMTNRLRDVLFMEAAGDRPGYYLAAANPERCLVLLHGISRNAAEIICRFAADAAFDDYTLVAPLFTADQFGRYQQMRAKPTQTRSDVALGNLLDHLAETNLATAERFDLFGFSGGAQMAHRYEMFHPRRLRSVIAVAAGWYTLPDETRTYPHGLAHGDGTPDPKEFLAVPVTVAVGGLDCRADAALRRSLRLDLEQGVTRIERARNWVDAMNKVSRAHDRAEAARLVILPGGTHDFGQCVREAGLLGIVAEALRGHTSSDPSCL